VTWGRCQGRRGGSSTRRSTHLGWRSEQRTTCCAGRPGHLRGERRLRCCFRADRGGV